MTYLGEITIATYILSKAYKTLNLIRRTFKSSYSLSIKTKLYMTLVRSLTYCSPVWQPYLLSDINNLERIQCSATKYILNNYTNDYKSTLINLNILPLMYTYEIADILFLIKSTRNSTSSFNINNYITFYTGSSQLAKAHKLQHSFDTNNTSRHSYFNRIPHLWNALPVINLNLSINTIKKHLRTFLFNHFITNFDSANSCSFHFLCPCARCQSLPKPPNFNDL